MFKKGNFKINSQWAGERLDKVLPTLTGLSRKKIKGLLDAGLVKVNGKKVIIASWMMDEGDRIELQVDGEAPQTAADEYYLKVVHEDKDLIVVDKDPGVACEKSPIAMRPTLVAIINAYFKRKYPHLKHHYLGLVHRLDQETSGLMVYTKTKEANKITDQFKRHTIHRRYTAVVSGRVEKDEGKIEGFLKKSSLLSHGRKVASSTEASGSRAITLYRVLERYHQATLVELQLNTGRTHQIRVHMAELGHPVLGDKIYGSGDFKFARQALHASYLMFHHPVTNQKMEFRAELPRDLRKLVDRLRVRS